FLHAGCYHTSTTEKETAVGATVSRGAGVPQSGPAGLLGDFRSRLYECLTTRRDALFGLADAALCEDRPVRDLARLSLAPEAGRGWPYSFVAALSPGRSSWSLLLDAVRVGPDDDECALAAAQLREVVTRLAAAGHWRPGSPPVIIAMDARYSPVRLAWLLRDL